MNIMTTAIATFVLVGIMVIGVAFWATWYPKLLCQKARDKTEEYNICVRHKNHGGPHMDVNGRKFREKR